MEKDQKNALSAEVSMLLSANTDYFIVGDALGRLLNRLGSKSICNKLRCLIKKVIVMRHDLLKDVLHVVNNAEIIGERMCIVPASSLVKNVLMVMQKSGYIGDFEFIDDGKSGKFRIELIGKINKSHAIRPRFAVKHDKYEKWASRYLPSRGFGILIISTPKGVMNHNEAIEAGVGGRLLGFVY